MGDMHIDSALMRYELHRLQSFSNVEGNESVSFLRLAKEGFYYISHIDLVKCYFCGYEWHDRSDGNIPDHCVEKNLNIPIHPDKTHSLLVPSGQSITPHTATHFYHRIRPLTFLDCASVTDLYRQHNSEELNTSGNGSNENLSSCESFQKEFESNKSRQRQRLNEDHTGSIPDSAVEIEGSVDSEFTKCTERARETYKTCTKPNRPNRASATPIGPQCATRNRHTTVNHAAVPPEDSSERCRMNSKPFGNSDKGVLYPSDIGRHPGANRSLLHLGKRVKTCPGVPQIYMDRLATFQGVSLPQPADILAANGFYYIGDSDVVKCAYCGGVWHVKDNKQTSDTVHTPDCKIILTPEISESRDTSSQPNSLSDIEVSSLPAVQEVKTFGIQTPDIVNAYREISLNIDFRLVTPTEIIGYLFEDDKDDGIPDENGSGCMCCNCFRDVISEMYLPCRHGCCCDCKTRVLRHCPKCDAIIKSQIDIFIS